MKRRKNSNSCTDQKLLNTRVYCINIYNNRCDNKIGCGFRCELHFFLNFLKQCFQSIKLILHHRHQRILRNEAFILHFSDHFFTL